MLTKPKAKKSPLRPMNVDRFPYYKTKIFRKMTGISSSMLNKFIQLEILNPCHMPTGARPANVFSHYEVLAVIAGRYYREAGFDCGWCAAAVKLIADLGPKFFEELKAGRAWLAPGVWLKKDGNTVYIPGQMVNPPTDRTKASAELVAAYCGHAIVDKFFERVKQVSPTAAKVFGEIEREVNRKMRKRRSTK